jgi:hypothetical protein
MGLLVKWLISAAIQKLIDIHQSPSKKNEVLLLEILIKIYLNPSDLIHKQRKGGMLNN